MDPQHDVSKADLAEMASGLEGDLKELEALTPRIEALRSFLAVHPRQAPPPAPLAFTGPRTPPAEPRHEDVSPMDPEVTPERVLDRRSAVAVRFGWLRRVWIPVAAILTAIAGGAVLAPRLLPSWSAGATTGVVSIETNPPGIQVILDDAPRGLTPFTAEVPPGDHVVELLTESDHRRIPITITPGSRVVQVLELPRGTATVGGLQLRTDPPGVPVTVDGEAAGKSPLTLPRLAPGVHTVILGSGTGPVVTERVVIEGGKTASLVVSMAAPSGATAAGWISLVVPADVQVYERGQLLGSSRIERIMLPAGRHDLEVVNDELGLRQSQAVQVTTGRVSRVTVDWPKGSVALNALPWAEVSIDGQRVGDTPLGNLVIPIGLHEVVFRHPNLGEQRRTVTVRADQPAKVGVDLRTR